MKWYLLAWKQYFKFSGRTRRKAFWMFLLMNLLISVVIEILDFALGTKIGATEPFVTGNYWVDVYNAYDASGAGVISTFYAILMIIPTLSITVRRLHDINLSGLWLLTYILALLLLFVGLFFRIMHWPGGILLYYVAFVLMALLSIILLICNCIKGTEGTNKYGNDPKVVHELQGLGGVFENTSK